MKFNQITIVDPCGLTYPELDQIALLSHHPIKIYPDLPQSEQEIMDRMADSDCILVSWRTRITEKMLRQATALKFVGMCCSLYDEKSANVDIVTAKELGIGVKGVRDYGDEGTVEYIFSQLVLLMQGDGRRGWREEASELNGKSMGIIGLGTLGLMVARTANHFGMKVSYYSRTRKPSLESDQLHYLPLHELLATCDIVTTHLPKHTLLLTEAEFRVKKRNSILVNTSLGFTFDKEAFLQWLANDPTSFAIMDGAGVGQYGPELAHHDRILLSKNSAGFTAEARKRLSIKVLQNLNDFLQSETANR